MLPVSTTFISSVSKYETPTWLGTSLGPSDSALNKIDKSFCSYSMCEAWSLLFRGSYQCSRLFLAPALRRHSVFALRVGILTYYIIINFTACKLLTLPHEQRE